VGVVVVRVLLEHRCGVPLVDDQEAVEEFAADAADETFGDRASTCPMSMVGAEAVRRRVPAARTSRGRARCASSPTRLGGFVPRGRCPTPTRPIARSTLAGGADLSRRSGNCLFNVRLGGHAKGIVDS
jgi:hypothetical protein